MLASGEAGRQLNELPKWRWSVKLASLNVIRNLTFLFSRRSLRHQKQSLRDRYSFVGQMNKTHGSVSSYPHRHPHTAMPTTNYQ